MVSGLGLDVSFVILDEQIKSKKQEENNREGMNNFCAPVSKSFYISHSVSYFYKYNCGISSWLWSFKLSDRKLGTVLPDSKDFFNYLKCIINDLLI